MLVTTGRVYPIGTSSAPTQLAVGCGLWVCPGGSGGLLPVAVDELVGAGECAARDVVGVGVGSGDGARGVAVGCGVGLAAGVITEP